MHEQVCNHITLSIKKLRCSTDQHAHRHISHIWTCISIHCFTWKQTRIYSQAIQPLFFPHTAPALETTQHVYQCFLAGWVYFWWSRLWNLAPEGRLPSSIAFTSNHSNLSCISVQFGQIFQVIHTWNFNFMQTFLFFINDIKGQTKILGGWGLATSINSLYEKHYANHKLTLTFTINISTKPVIHK